MTHILAFFFNLFTTILFPAILLLLILIVELIFWRRAFARKLLLVAVLGFYFTANGLIPKLLIYPLEKGLTTIDEQTITAHHVMIVLGGGISGYDKETKPEITSYARVLEAYRIYKIAQENQVQYTIFLSGGNTSGSSMSEAQLFKNLLLQLGVAEQDLIIEDKSMNTFENAQFLKPILDKYKFKRFLLVTSALHMKRAINYFEHFNIETIPAPSDFPYPLMSVLPNAYNLVLQQMAMHEYWGILRLFLYNYLSLNER